MTDRDSYQDWQEDNDRFEAEEEAEWRQTERDVAAQIAWEASRCERDGCDNEGTDKLGDVYVCPSCFEKAFQAMYDREREMGR